MTADHRRDRRTFPALVLLALACALPLSTTSFAAEVIIINNDAPGTGLNDPTVVAPVAGNMGTTLGEQRLNVLQRAAEIWADNLISDVPISILAQTALQFCDATSATLASAGAVQVFRDFANAPLANTWYHSALANAIAGVDLDAAQADISTQFNLNLDADPNCLGGNGWYYGFDHEEGAQTDLLAVMLHEYGHGLGFSNFVNDATGVLFANTPDVYTTHTRDVETGEDWNDMTNAERAASAINDPDVVWTGAAVTAAIPDFLGNPVVLTVDTPAAIQGNYDAQSASFGPAVPQEGISGTVILATDGTGETNDACEALTNGGAISGNIALVDRGSCNFTVKVINAQNAGAVGVLVANNVATGLPPMGGDDPAVTIPSIGIAQSAGDAIKGQLPAPGVTATLGYDETQLAGARSGFLRVHAPNPVAPGSSISHWTVDATPSLLMEPAITPQLTDDVDLTLEHFTDIGWQLIDVFADGFESGDCTVWTSSTNSCVD